MSPVLLPLLTRRLLLLSSGFMALTTLAAIPLRFTIGRFPVTSSILIACSNFFRIDARFDTSFCKLGIRSDTYAFVVFILLSTNDDDSKLSVVVVVASFVLSSKFEK